MVGMKGGVVFDSQSEEGVIESEESWCPAGSVANLDSSEFSAIR